MASEQKCVKNGIKFIGGVVNASFDNKEKMSRGEVIREAKRWEKHYRKGLRVTNETHHKCRTSPLGTENQIDCI